LNFSSVGGIGFFFHTPFQIGFSLVGGIGKGVFESESGNKYCENCRQGG